MRNRRKENLPDDTHPHHTLPDRCHGYHGLNTGHLCRSAQGTDPTISAEKSRGHDRGWDEDDTACPIPHSQIDPPV